MKLLITLWIMGLALFAIPNSAAQTIHSNTVTGRCVNSYFIKKNSDILSTMNLLITGENMPQNDFDCQSFVMNTTKTLDYNLVINTSYGNVEYQLQFIGKQSNNNNGMVFIPSQISIKNDASNETKTYQGDDIIGACTYDPKNVLNKEKVMCLVSIHENDQTSIAIKIHFR